MIPAHGWEEDETLTEESMHMNISYVYERCVDCGTVRYHHWVATPPREPYDDEEEQDAAFDLALDEAMKREITPHDWTYDWPSNRDDIQRFDVTDETPEPPCLPARAQVLHELEDLGYRIDGVATAVADEPENVEHPNALQ